MLPPLAAGERLLEELAPELLPMLAGVRMPANFVPITNTLLAELQRRGVGRQRLLWTLRTLGCELPTAVEAVLRRATAAKVPVHVMSDCNAVFISEILAGAGLASLVNTVVTNHADFVAVEDYGACPGLAAAASPSAAAGEAKLVVQPYHGTGSQAGGAPHCCPRCPESLCKGIEIGRLRAAHPGRRIIYVGDGANDICPALQLIAGDVLLARGGHTLAAFVQSAAGEAAAAEDKAVDQGSPAARIMAQSHIWDSHEQLALLFRRLLA